MNTRIHEAYLALSDILNETAHDKLLKRLGSDKSLDELARLCQVVASKIIEARFTRDRARSFGVVC